MNPIDVARRLASAFADDGLAYGLGGALALGVWGAPRATKDVDVSVFVDSRELARVLESLERAGAMVRREDAARDVARIGLFQARLGKIVIDVFISDHSQAREMASRVRRIAEPDGTVLAFISAEDLCVHKLLFGRSKDVADLERLFAVRAIDTAYVRSWLVQMVPSGDRRLAVLEDLERRFGAKA
jgi:hypothetical protein